MKPRWPLASIRSRLLLSLIGYLLVLTVVLTAFVTISNERAERFTWTTLLDSEMASFEGTSSPIRSSSVLGFRGTDPRPAAFASLGTGIHDDIRYNGRFYAALVKEHADGMWTVAIDTTEIENREHRLMRDVALAILAMMLLFGLLGAWGLSRGLRPLNQVVENIHGLDFDSEPGALTVPADATRELRTIADAVNGYAQRNRDFVQRERAFINAASHELRTPVAVLKTQLELAAAESDPTRLQRRLTRASQMTTDIESLLKMLLTLARDPARLAPMAEPISLNAVVENQVALHAGLLAEKELRVEMQASDDVTVIAPPQIVDIAVANLVRNAMENSDRGVIQIQVHSPGVLQIADPGHGMTPQEISAMYARAVRDESGVSSGIGMQLLARISEHLGWTLRYEDANGHGTIATLDLSHSAADDVA